MGKLIAVAVPRDTLSWQMYDPQATVPVAAVSDHPVPFDIQLAHCEIEQAGHEPDAFRQLARSGRPVTTLGRATAGEPGISRRFRELLAAAGIRHELRAALVHQRSCWGTLVLLRTHGQDFTGVELRWVNGIAAEIAAAIKRRLVSPAPAPGLPGAGQPLGSPLQPGVITLRRGARRSH